jgi:hypothetical protein
VILSGPIGSKQRTEMGLNRLYKRSQKTIDINIQTKIPRHLRRSHTPVVLGRATELPSLSKGLEREVRLRSVATG